MDFIGRTNPDFVIRGTSFTTLTVNRNWQTALHTDRGDLPEGFGVLTCLRSGEYEGGFLVMPKYRVAVDMTSGCVLCANVHEWHGNSVIRHGAKWERITCVFYARKKMIFCGSAADELERAKRRQPGDPLATDDLNSINADPAGT